MVLGAITAAFQTIVDVFRTITGWAPKPLKLLMFLIVGLASMSLIVNLFIATPYVCSEDEVYKAKNVFWAFSAKALDPYLEFTEGTSDEFKDIASEFNVPNLESPTAIGLLTDEDYAFISFNQFGSFLTPARETVPSVITGLPNSGIVADTLMMALPLATNNFYIVDFTDFHKLLIDGDPDTAPTITGDIEQIEMAVCKIPADSDMTSSKRERLSQKYGALQNGDCFLIDQTMNFCPWRTETIMGITYTLNPLDSDDPRESIETNTPDTTPGQLNINGQKWAFNIEVHNPLKFSLSATLLEFFTLGFVDAAEEPLRSLNNCPQQYHRGTASILLEPNADQFEEGIFRRTQVEVPAQRGFVKAQYVAVSEAGIDLIATDSGTELRHLFLQSNPGKFKLVTQKSGGAISYVCTAEQEVDVRLFGIPVFDPIFIFLFLFLSGLLTFVVKYIL